MNSKTLSKVYEILAVMRFNPERRPICADVLRDVLINDLGETDIVKLARSKKPRIEAGEGIDPQKIFKEMDNDFILNVRISDLDTLEYLEKRYLPYDKEFRKEYGTTIYDFVVPAQLCLDLQVQRLKRMGFVFDEAIFNGKEEYADFGLVKMPSKSYVDNWSRLMTISRKEIIEKLPPEVSLNVDFFLNNYSFTQADLKADPEIRFQEKPILRLNDDVFVVAFPFLLIRCLPHKLEILLKRSQDYLNDRGHVFENLALEEASKIKCQRFRENLFFEGGEIDGLLEFDDSCWFVECKSRPPSLKALRGDGSAIQNDLEKTVGEAEAQATRAYEHLEEFNLPEQVKKKVGLLVVLEGTYPQLNQNTAFSLAQSNFKQPRLIINYFDLKEIVRQPDAHIFKDFLFWRTQANMPLVCFDELDYWTWFAKSTSDPLRIESFRLAQEKQIRLFYMGDRFNAKKKIVLK